MARIKHMSGNHTRVMVAVARGMALPRIGETLSVVSDLTGYEYVVEVEAIRALRWLPDGRLEVTVSVIKSAAHAAQLALVDAQAEQAKEA